MKKTLHKTFFYFLFFILINITFLTNGFAQKIIIKGKITDVTTKEALPFVNVYIKNADGTLKGVVSDDNGKYTMEVPNKKDTLFAVFMGYQMGKKVINLSLLQTIDFKLIPDDESIGEVVVSGRKKDNPAWAIIRNAVKNKAKNSPANLDAYQYDMYNRLEGYIRPNGRGISKMKLLREMQKVSSKYPQLKDEKGLPLVPIIVSEGVGTKYVSKKPKRDREIITNSNINGIGIENTEGLGDILTKSTVANFNFYNNEVIIFKKYFLSPVADGWRVMYDYDLLDSVMVDKDFCYKLNIVPKNSSDLAFVGTLWITKKDFAIKKIEARASDNANINFVSGIKINQTFAQVETDVWLPQSIDFEMQVKDISDLIPEMYMKTHIDNKNYIINKPKEIDFYDEKASDAKTIATKDTTFWKEYRKDSSLVNQLNVTSLIDSMKAIPAVRSYTRTLTVLASGYFEGSKIEIGHWARFYAWNNIEGHRLGFGFRTSSLWSRKVRFDTRIAYGTNDNKIKYNAHLRYVFAYGKKYAAIGIRRLEDIEPLIQLNLYESLPQLFLAANRFGNITKVRPFFKQETTIYAEKRINFDFLQKITFSHRVLKPLYNFGYYAKEGIPEISTDLTTSEITLQSTYQKGSSRTQLDPDTEVNLSGVSRPKFSLVGVIGMKGVFGSQFEYQKLFLDISQKNIRTGSLGSADYAINVGHIFSPVPYPLLKTHLGNNTPFFVNRAFNMMQGFEFVSSSYASVSYTQFFGGFILDRIPLMKTINKKLKWRLLGSFNMLYGTIDEKNLRLLPKQTATGEPIQKFRKLSPGIPYMEIGYGVDNIFKFFRIDFIHRLNYLDSPGSKSFGIKFLAQIKL